jgi:predicted MPP superfamily phosphohydrolase
MEVTRRSVLKALVAAAMGGVTGASAHGYWYERHAMKVVEARMSVVGLAPALDGVRIGFLTDFHHSALVSQSQIAGAVALVMSATPDLIVLGGDYVTNADRTYMGACAEALAPLDAPAGVFAILGNHDDDREMPAALTAKRFAVLRDARTTVLLRGEPLDLVGIRYWTRRASTIARLVSRAAVTTLLLAHDPRRLTQAADLGIPAVLSGHTHGGQVVLPAVGALAGRKFPVVAGLGTRNGTTLFVSRGIGTVYIPIRINCPPDVSIVTLAPAAAT